MAASNSDAGKPKLTERDLEILSKTWGCMKTQPEIDFDKLAQACGMTNPRSASNAWGSIKKKLFADLPAGITPTKATPKKRKNGKPATGDSGEDADDSPTKKSRANPRKTKATPKSDIKKEKATVKKENQDASSKVKDEGSSELSSAEDTSDDI